MAVGYVLVNVSPGNEYGAFQMIKDIENVVDTTLLFGDYDIIRQVPGVTDSKTLAGAEI
jgi:hypothetical protein